MLLGGEDDHELLAAVAVGHVALPQLVRHHAGDCPQGPVAGLVAEAVVVGLEAVEVEEGQRVAVVAASGPCVERVEVLAQPQAVAEPVSGSARASRASVALRRSSSSSRAARLACRPTTRSARISRASSWAKSTGLVR